MACVPSEDGKEIQEFLANHEPGVMCLSRCEWPLPTTPAANPDHTRNFIVAAHAGRWEESGEICERCTYVITDEGVRTIQGLFQFGRYKVRRHRDIIAHRRLKEPKSMRFNFDGEGDELDKEGRVNVVELDEFSVLHTFVPNNGLGRVILNGVANGMKGLNCS